MLKNKFKLIIILLFVILLFNIPIVKAANEINDQNNAGYINEDPEANKRANQETEQVSDNAQSNAENKLVNDDVYIVGDDITIDYPINGNLFVIANNVTINSQIGGDVFVLSNNMTVKEDSYIFSNLFTASKNITINGVVYNLYSASNNLTINGYVGRDIKSTSKTINILGSIERNAYINCTNLNFSQEIDGEMFNGTIDGNLNYSSPQEISIPDNTVSGEVSFEKIGLSNENTVQKQVISMGTFVIFFM